MPLEDKIWAIAQEVANQPGFTVDLNRMRRAADEGYCVAFAATQGEFGQDGLANMQEGQTAKGSLVDGTIVICTF
jgi:hypothetical protein